MKTEKENGNEKDLEIKLEKTIHEGDIAKVVEIMATIDKLKNKEG